MWFVSTTRNPCALVFLCLGASMFARVFVRDRG